MNKPKVKKVKLSPFVYIIKGIKNYALYDLYNHRLFGVIPEGNIDDLKKQLLDTGLALETDGVIPFKYEINIDNYKKHLLIRELQIRITGQCERNCPDCGEICQCFKSTGDMSIEVMHNVITQFKSIPLTQVLITGGNPLLRLDIAENMRNSLSASQFTFLYKCDIENSELEKIKNKGFEITSTSPFNREIKRKSLMTKAFSYFYSQRYNICWGHKIAIDLDGAIKICLWSEKILGNILKDDIKEMIRKGIFDEYWNLAKDKITICKECEYRYGCPDCRVQTFKNTGLYTEKDSCCTYDPKSGIWLSN